MSTLGQGMKEQAQTDARREIRLSQKLGAADQAGEESVGGSRAQNQERPECLFLHLRLLSTPAWCLEAASWEKERVGVNNSRD